MNKKELLEVVLKSFYVLLLNVLCVFGLESLKPHIALFMVCVVAVSYVNSRFGLLFIMDKAQKEHNQLLRELKAQMESNAQLILSGVLRQREELYKPKAPEAPN